MKTLDIQAITLRKLEKQARQQGRSVDDLLNQLLATQEQTGSLDERRFFHLSVDMFCVASDAGIILRVNDAFARTLGYQPEALLGHHLLEFVHPDDYQSTLDAMERHVGGEIRESFENRYRHASGGYRWLAWSVAPTTGGRTYAIARDVTEAKLREQELRARNEELDAFAYTVAHDLKNPISGMVGFASLIRAYYHLLDDETLASYATEIVEGGYQVREIIDSLLLLARMRQAKMPPVERLDMYCILETVTDRLRQQISSSGAVIHMPEAWPVVRSYGPWIEQVWINYLNNAIKYGGQPPVIEVGADYVDPGHVRYWVRDNGPGLTPEQQARLFRPFTRLDTARAEGHGLGLSIVRRIIQRLGGEVGVESVPGAGSRFFFVLPI
ncbi:MAG: sensor histidine kinase [Chloroflexota bacterium]